MQRKKFVADFSQKRVALQVHIESRNIFTESLGNSKLQTSGKGIAKDLTGSICSSLKQGVPGDVKDAVCMVKLLRLDEDREGDEALTVEER